MFGGTLASADGKKITANCTACVAGLSYSLVAYSPYEGWRATLIGTGGRMELREDETGPLVQESSSTIAVCNTSGELEVHETPRAAGDHGGGDAQILERLFGGQSLPDPLGRIVGGRDVRAAWSGGEQVHGYRRIGVDRRATARASVASEVRRFHCVPGAAGAPARHINCIRL